MRLEDLFAEVVTKKEKNENLFLNLSKITHIALIAPEIQELYRRLVGGEKFAFCNIFANFSDDRPEHYIYSHEELKDRIDELNISSLANHAFSSYRKDGGKILESIKTKEIYLSLVNIEYPSRTGKERLIAPLFFLKIKLEKNGDDLFMSLIDDDPIYNADLLNKLHGTFDIKIECDHVVFDLENLENYIKSQDTNEVLNIMAGADICALPLLEQERYWFILDSQSKIAENPLSRLLEGKSSATREVEAHILSNDVTLKKLYDTMEMANAAIIKVDDKGLEKHLIREITVDYLSAGQSVTVAGKASAEAKILVNKFNCESLVYNPQEQADFLLAPGRDILARRSAEVFDNSEVLTSYDDLTSAAQKAISLDIKNDRVLLSRIFANYSAYNKTKYHFDLDDYANEDYTHDRHFFEKLGTFASFKSIPLSKHPFYGLTVRADENTYQEIKEDIKKTLADIGNFTRQLKLMNFSDWGYEKIDTYIGYQRLSKHFDILKDYQGGYYPYLQMELEDYHPDELEELITKYNVESSTKSSIDINVVPEFWDADLESLVADLDGKGPDFKAAREKLLDFQKDKDKKNFNYFVRLIKMYLDNEQSIHDLQVRFGEIGLDVSTLDKAAEVQVAFEYKRRFITHVRLYNDIDFKNNAFLQKYFTDSSLRDRYKDEVFVSLQEYSAKLAVDFDNLHNLFDSGEQIDYETMPFAAMKNYLTGIDKISHETYLDYYNFTDALTRISLPLKNVVDKLIADNESFDNLEVDFFSSIFIAYREIVIKKCRLSENPIRLFRPLWRSELQSSPSNELAGKIENIYGNIKTYLSSEDFKKPFFEIKKTIYSCKFVQKSSLIKKYSSVINKIRPLHIFDKIDRFDRLTFGDITIITGFSQLSDLDLLEIIALSKKIIFVDYGDDLSVDIAGNQVPINTLIPEIKYDSAALFSSVDYSVMDSHLVNLLAHYANKLGYSLKKDYADGSIIYPLALIRPGCRKPSFVLIPDLGIRNRPNVLRTVFPLLSSIFEVTPIELPLLFASLLPLETLKFIIEPVSLVQNAIDEDFADDLSVEDVDGKKERYIHQLKVLQSSFIKKNKLTDADDYDENYILEALPVYANDIQGCSDGLKARIAAMIEEQKIVKKEDAYYPVNTDYIALHLAEGNRFFAEELEKGIFKYLSCFSFLTLETLKQELAKVLEIPEDDPFLNDGIQRAIIKFSREKKVSVSSSKQISLHKLI